MEARLYFRVTIAGIQETLALCSLYSPANGQLNRESYGALNAFDYRGKESLVVIQAIAILSVVAMVPFGEPVQGHNTRFSSVEKFALGVVDKGIILE